MQSLLEEKLVTSDVKVRFNRNFEETETELRIFFENVLKSLYKLPHMKFSNIRQSLSNIRSYRNRDIEVHEIVDFEENYDRCAYFFAYCIIHSLVTYDRFSDMMKDNPSMLKKIVSMKNMRLCILGGGPAFEAAAICKLLSKILVMFGPSKRPPLQVHITVIDVCADWKIEAERVIKSIQTELCTDNNIEVDYSFIEADLTEKFSPTVIKAIKKSHFVTMLKFVTDVNEAYIEKKVLGMIHEILESISCKSCLFFLDNSGGGVFKKIDKLIDGLPCTTRIYGPTLYYTYQLDVDTVDKFSAGVSDIFRTLKCTCRTTVSTSAWIKVRDILEPEEINLNISPAVLEDLVKHKCKPKPPKIKVKKKVVQTLKNLSEDEESDSTSACVEVRDILEPEEINVNKSPAVLEDLVKPKCKPKPPKIKAKKKVVQTLKNLSEDEESDSTSAWIKFRDILEPEEINVNKSPAVLEDLVKHKCKPKPPKIKVKKKGGANT